MERLTKRAYGGITYSKTREITCSSFCSDCSAGTGNCNIVKKMVEKLANLEDAEEQGLLVRLPCKVGDKVYVIAGKNISEQKIQRVTIGSECKFEFCTRKRGFALFDIGKTVFLTREEAKVKLKEMEDK